MSRARISLSSSSAIVRETASSSITTSIDEPRQPVAALAGSRLRLSQCIEEPGDLADGHRAQLDQGLAANLDRPRAGIEPGSRTFRAGHAAHVRLELAADRAARCAAILGQAARWRRPPISRRATRPCSGSSSGERSSDHRCRRATRGAISHRGRATGPAASIPSGGPSGSASRLAASPS